MLPTLLALLIWWAAVIGALIMRRISEASSAYAIYAAIIATIFDLFIHWYCNAHLG